MLVIYIILLWYQLIYHLYQRTESHRQAESPDEGALVEAVAQLGWSFTGRSNEGLTVEAWETRGKHVGKMRVLYDFIWRSGEIYGFYNVLYIDYGKKYENILKYQR